MGDGISGPAQPVVVFDVGNVLLYWDPRRLYRKIFVSEAEVDWFLAHVCTMDWNLMQDGGRNWATGVAALCALHPESASQIAAYDLRLAEMTAGPVAPSVAVLEALKESGRPVYAITNFSTEKWAESQMRYPFLTLFDGVIVSGHEKLLKPDPAIHGMLFERYGLVADQCVFIDDSAKNIAAASALGMQAIHFLPEMDLRAELTALGVKL